MTGGPSRWPSRDGGADRVVANETRFLRHLRCPVIRPLIPARPLAGAAAADHLWLNP
jgi:hypothetical protein